MEVSRNSKVSLERGAVFPGRLFSNQRPLVRVELVISFKVILKLTKSECAKALH